VKQLPDAVRKGGMCLALSGGGFRATLFHLGAIRRLSELGALDNLASITGVSGGGIMLMALSEAMIRQGGRLTDVEDLARIVHGLVTYNLRRTIFLKRLLPQNWATPFGHLVARELEKHVGNHNLRDLPATPNLMFVATDMVFGVDWIFSRDKAGNYQAGYSSTGLEKVSLGYAAACSACFPPIFKPIETRIVPSTFTGGKATTPADDQLRTEIVLSDGGVYDNMGLEPVWKQAEILLVSDAGGLFEFERARGTLTDVERYPDIMGNQARALRKRWLISSFMNKPSPGDVGGLNGTYWATSSCGASYDPGETEGYTQAIATLIANVRTDLNNFTEGEIAAIENHGYFMAAIAIRKWVPQIYKAVPVKPPFPDWLDEKKVAAALKDSAKQKL
jgi:NTE family protein